MTMYIVPQTSTVRITSMGTITVHFSETIYREGAILEAIHELSSEFPSVMARVDGHFEVTVTDLRDAEQEASVRLWLTQLVNDGEIRARLDSSLGRVRDVVIAAAFSKIVLDPSVENSEKSERIR
jgi:His-Xaa-Ser system protein HxsD